MLVRLALQSCLAKIRSTDKECVYCITSCFIYAACNGTEVMSSSNLGAISNDVNEVQFRRPQIMHMYS